MKFTNKDQDHCEFLVNEYNKKLDEISELKALMISGKDWVAVDGAEDINVFTEILCFDGCEINIDYVEVCAETGAHYMANGTEVTHWMLLPDQPKETV